VEDRLPRHSFLYRPQVANVDMLILVMALKSPDPDWQMADRLLVLAERQNLDALLCLNKTDLLSASDLAQISRMLNSFPYPYILTSALHGQGIEGLKNRLKGSLSVFAGPSGSGKSSLLNAVQPGLSLKSGFISEKIKRGRHTTRTAEIVFLEQGGSVVDTPGFTRLKLLDLLPEQLDRFFPEMDIYRSRCSFRNCRHISEPGCAVREAVSEDKINNLRYDNYKLFYQELSDRSSD